LSAERIFWASSGWQMPCSPKGYKRGWIYEAFCLFFHSFSNFLRLI